MPLSPRLDVPLNQSAAWILGDCLTPLESIDTNRKWNAVSVYKSSKRVKPHDRVALKHTLQFEHDDVVARKCVVDRSRLGNAMGHARWAQHLECMDDHHLPAQP